MWREAKEEQGVRERAKLPCEGEWVLCGGILWAARDTGLAGLWWDGRHHLYSMARKQREGFISFFMTSYDGTPQGTFAAEISCVDPRW